MIDPAGLKALIALADHGTVAAAADALGYTPSAVSQQLKRLHGEIGTPVTEQVGRTLRLTPAGQTLVGDGRDLLVQWADLEARLPTAGAALSGRLSIAGFATGVRGLLAPVVAELAEVAPGLQIGLHEIEVDPAIDGVRTGRYDAALVHAWRGLPAQIPGDLVVDEVCTDRADVAVRADHPLAAAERVTPAALIEDLWTVQPPGTICHRWFLHMFQAVAHTPPRCWQIAEYATQLEMVARLGAVALIPRLGRTGPLEAGSGPATSGGIRFLRVEQPVPQREVSIVWRHGLRGTAVHRTTLQLLRRHSP